MKKKILFSLTLILFVTMLPIINVNASAEVKLKDVPSQTTLKQGETLTIDTFAISGNCLNVHTADRQKPYIFDETVFEFVSFKSDYVDFQPMVITWWNKTGCIPVEMVQDNEPDLFWTMTLKVKDTAKVGETIVNNNTYIIAEKPKEENPPVDTDNEADKDNSSDNNTDSTSTTQSSNNIKDCILYASLTINSVLLIALIVVLLKKKKSI